MQHISKLISPLEMIVTISFIICVGLKVNHQGSLLTLEKVV